MPPNRTLSRLKSVDFYKKIPTDLTEATLTGAWISIAAAVIMVVLLVAELGAFLSTQTTTEMVVDRGGSQELLKITFNISFPALSCEFATLDVSDALGTKRMNLTKTVRKVPVDASLVRMGPAYEDTQKEGPKYEDENWDMNYDVSSPITHENFLLTVAHYPITVVNFYAPWCHWCQRLEPTWEAATVAVHEKYPDTDGRIRFAKVDCTQEQELCQQNFITGFPSIRVFRKGHDDIFIMGQHDHEAYTGDRTLQALTDFADSLVPSAGMPRTKHAQLSSGPLTAGCNMAGFVLVKKVPGTLHFTARGEGHSFDHAWMNLTHVVHGLYFGSRPTPRKYYELKKLHPLGLETNWMDKMHGESFYSDHPQHTHEHYLQVVMTTIEPLGGRSRGYDAYEYVAHSHTFTSDNVPSAKFTYSLSPIQVVVREQPRRWYHFLTTTCAIIGGVFTVAGILDSILYSTLKMAKKVELGKQG